MKTFNKFLVEEKNLHMTHLEDLVFNDGVEGTRKAINFLRDLRDMLAGHSKSKISATVKWDGCVHEDTIVLTNMGDMPIKEIVRREDLWGELEIMGRNLNGQIWPYDGPSLLISGNAAEGQKNWVEIVLEDGTILKTTADHEFHTSNRGWVKAGDLTLDDDITEL